MQIYQTQKETNPAVTTPDSNSETLCTPFPQRWLILKPLNSGSVAGWIKKMGQTSLSRRDNLECFAGTSGVVDAPVRQGGKRHPWSSLAWSWGLISVWHAVSCLSPTTAQKFCHLQCALSTPPTCPRTVSENGHHQNQSWPLQPAAMHTTHVPNSS